MNNNFVYILCEWVYWRKFVLYYYNVISVVSLIAIPSTNTNHDKFESSKSYVKAIFKYEIFAKPARAKSPTRSKRGGCIEI